MTTTWMARHQAAKDRCYRAWDLLRPMEPDSEAGRRLLGDIGEALSEPLQDLARALDVDLDDGRFRKVLVQAVSGVYMHVGYAVRDAMADLMATPEPQPYSPPPARSWMRDRSLRESPSGPRWNGVWHRFTGDLERGDVRFQDVYGVTSCGRRIHLSGELGGMAAIAEDQPAVDACRRCARPGAAA